MKFYALVGSNLQMVDEAGSGAPEGWTEMLAVRPDDEDTADYTAQPDGTWAITEETINAKLMPIELSWRTSTLAVIARQLEAIEEDEAEETPPDFLPGTRKQWLKYRGQVSNWGDGNPDFPNSSKRPLAPA